MKHFLITICLFVSFATEAFARTTIKIGAYDFPPFIEWTESKPDGLLPEFILILNRIQDKFTFKLVETTANRRFMDLKRNHFDIIFFEDINWGWDKNKFMMSDIFLTGGEIFIAKNKTGRTQQYFEELNSKTIRAFLGYHYAFLNYSNDPQFLKKWKLEFTNNHHGNILSVINERSDLAIVTREYLLIVLKENPEFRKQLLISEKLDQVYQMGAVFKLNPKITVEEVNHILDKVKADQKFKTLFQDFVVKI